MSPKRRLGKKLFKSLLPIFGLVILAAVVSVGLIVYGITRPPRRSYLVTPKSFQLISTSALRVSDESWRNRDGTQARGWLLKGGEGAPAVILLHRYGVDRSWLFNLGVKLNEATNFTVLWPDLRGHGMDPPVKWTSFGIREGDDVLAALDFLRTLKTGSKPLVGEHVGFYGVELGALAALEAAQHHSEVTTLVLDSVPLSSDDLLREEVKEDLGLDNSLVHYLVRNALRIYFLGQYYNITTCEIAASLKDRHVLLLSGPEAESLQQSTAELARCFPSSMRAETKTDLPLTGYKLASATGEQGEVYDRRVIDFFDRNLR
jgi:pimeloyl-ACP methyl ester carboxylesterase